MVVMLCAGKRIKVGESDQEGEISYQVAVGREAAAVVSRKVGSTLIENG